MEKDAIFQSCLVQSLGLTKTLDIEKLYDLKGVKRISKIYDVAKKENQESISAYYKEKRVREITEEELIDVVEQNNKLLNIFKDIKELDK